MSFVNFIMARGSAGFAPNPEFDIDNYAKVAWYDVSDASAVVQASGTISKLIDKSGNGNDLQDTTISFPSYAANGGSNNKAFITIEEGGKNIYKDGISGGGTGTTAYLLIRFKNFTRTDVPGQGVVKTVFSYSSRTNGLIMDDQLRGYMPVMDSSGNRFSEMYINTRNTNWQLIVMNSIVTNGARFSNNRNAPPLTCTTNLTAMGPGNIWLGYYSLSANYELSELILVNNELTLENDFNIRNYLLTKYAITERGAMYIDGDSQSHGNCDTEDMWMYYVSDEKNLDLVNYAQGGSLVFPNNGSVGVAGRNFADTYTRFMEYPYHGQWAVIGYGVNDVNQGGVNADWEIGYKGYLQALIDFGYPANKIILVLPPSTSVRQSLMSECNTRIASIATSLGIVLYDANARILANGGDSLFGDTLHLNTTGNRVYADGINLIIG